MTHDNMQAVHALRAQLAEYRTAATPLAAWRAMQLEILEIAKRLQRAGGGPGSTGLWKLLEEHFWIERDDARLAVMVEDVLAAMEAHAASLHPFHSHHAAPPAESTGL